MDSYTLLFLREQHGRPTQILIPKHWVRPFVGFLGVLLVIAAGLGWAYWRLRADVLSVLMEEDKGPIEWVPDGPAEWAAVTILVRRPISVGSSPVILLLPRFQ